MFSDYKKEIEFYKIKYFSIRKVACPVFSNEFVYFTRRGFNHILRKGRRLRTVSEQLNRLRLVDLAPYILFISKNFEEYVIERDKNNISITIQSWSFVRYGLNNNKITLIVRQIGNGVKQFYSIF
jgi:hypothetical protein